MKTLGPLVRVKKATILKDYLVEITFEDDTTKIIDLDRYLQGPIFESIRANVDMFRDIRIEAGTLTWSNGADIDPDVLYYGLEPAPASEIATKS